VKIGIVGFGFMGMMHYRCWQALEDARVVAVCDANPNIVEDTQGAIGNIDGDIDAIDFDSLNIYSDLDRMLSDENLDAVSITLPTHLHAKFSIKALQAGVNVLCEKPMALNTADCKKMVDVANTSEKILMIGHCIRFWPEYAAAKELIDSGKYGKVIAATFQRLSSPPTWAKDDWFSDDQRSGGVVLDLHIHDTDYVQYLFGMPTAVASFGANDGGRSIHIVTQYLYDDRKSVTAEGSWAMTPSFGFKMSFNIVLEKASIVYDCTSDPALRVCPLEADEFTPELIEADGYSLEIEHFAQLIAGKNPEPVTTLEQSMNSVRIIMAEKKSIAEERKITIK
jgi:predicted dehydrogenase